MGDARFAFKFAFAKVVKFGDFVYYAFGGGGAELGGAGDADGAVFDEFKWGETADIRHHKNSRKLSLEVADVGVDIFGNVFDGLIFNFGTEELGFGAKDGTFIFKFWKLNIECSTHSKTRSEAFIDGFNLTGQTVACDDNLFAVLVEVIKDVEELLLGLLLVHDELEVVDDETVESLEFIAEIFAFLMHDSVDKLGEKV